jgi:hypothetical protein
MTPMNLFFAACAVAVYLGWKLPTERFITPVSGVGYALGIVGGSLMLVLLLYPARKRARWLGFLGSVKRWFQAHVILGIVGPVLILYHSNFSLGATNSNVALLCMLLVSGSGIIGRYFYIHIHFELYGRQMTLAEMKDNAARLQQASSTIPFLPELAQRLEHEEARLLARFARIPYYFRPLVTGIAALRARWRLHSYIRTAIRQGAQGSRVVRWQRSRLGRTARRFVDNRITACRRVAEFEAYARLFSFWHLLHVPLFLLLLVAGIVHVIAVHVY